MTRAAKGRTIFFFTYCFPVILGIALAQYLDIKSILALVLNVGIASAIVYGLLTAFYYPEEKSKSKEDDQ
jgi:presenilin-like A22 family membrane protease